MQQPGNAAAEQVVRAQSIIADLTAQLGAAIASQQALIDTLMPVAEWAPAGPPAEPEEPEVEE